MEDKDVECVVQKEMYYNYFLLNTGPVDSNNVMVSMKGVLISQSIYRKKQKNHKTQTLLDQISKLLTRPVKASVFLIS